MKISYASDIHLEFGKIELFNEDNADVLVLAGDICVSRDVLEKDSPVTNSNKNNSQMIHTFFQECCARFPHVIYIMGNHEHYNGDFALTHKVLKERLGYLENLHVLDKEVFTLDDIIFVCGTLWTDMNDEDRATMLQCGSRMNDYRRVINSAVEPVLFKAPSYGKKPDGSIDYDVTVMETHVRPAVFEPKHSVEDHYKMLSVIVDAAETYKAHKVVVVGHHSPSKKSIKPQYENDPLINGAYSSNLEQIMINNPNIKLWIHGHTHHNFDYVIGETRVVCNPRGYINYESQADNFKLATIEI